MYKFYIYIQVDIFSQFMACLFIFLMVSFRVYKCLIVMESNLFYGQCFLFSLYVYKSLSTAKLQILSHMFSSRRLKVLALIFFVYIHFELLFLICCEIGIKIIIYLHVISYCWKGCSNELLWDLCWQSTYMWILFWTL